MLDLYNIIGGMKLVSMKKLNLKQRRTMTYFIEATEKLIIEEGIDGLSIRKIATEAGYNSATIYNYFENLEILILYASVSYLSDYICNLKDVIKEEMTSLEIYRNIYSVFNKHSFRSPEIFYNMFFGNNSNKLTDIIKQYYEIFPDDLEGQTPSIKTMLTQGNIYHRDKPIVDMLAEDGVIDVEKTEIIIELMVRVHETFLLEAIRLNDDSEIEIHSKKFLKIFDYIIDSGKE